MKFAVVGDPIEHSRSPAIHTAAFEALGFDAEFGLMEVPVEEFARVVSALRSGELNGVSVTMPHKRNAFEAADKVSDVAERIGSVNTLTLDDGQLTGHNTDIAGVLCALGAVEGMNEAPILLLGHGGGAAAALLAIEGREIFLSGRNPENAEALLSRVGVEATVIPWGTPLAMATVINATPLGMEGESLPEGVVERAGALLDMAYGTDRTPAVAHGLALGIPVADGLTMLVGQAAEAFTLFTGRTAPVEIMEQAARR